MTRSTIDRLKDIILAVELVQRYAVGLDATSLEKADLLRDAVLFQFVCMGEAAGRLPAEIQGLAPEIPWGQIRGTRSNIVHGYWQIDFRVLADTIRLDLDALKAAVSRLTDLLEQPDP
jgi:uncharacterized protein with HEPN domain